MRSLIPHIILLCFGYLVTVEALYLDLIINNDAYGDSMENTNRANPTEPASVEWPQKTNIKQKEYKEIRKSLKNILTTLLEKNGHNNLRYTYRYPIPPINRFLKTLNNYMIRNNNRINYGAKRDNCYGFGNPGSSNTCNRGKPRQFNDWRGKHNRRYAQNMFKERARYDSDSESGSNDDSDNDSDNNRQSGQKSRFQIVDNAKGKKRKENAGSESYEEVKSKPYVSGSDESGGDDSSSEQKKPKKTKYNSDSGSVEQKVSDASDEKQEISNASDEKPKLSDVSGEKEDESDRSDIDSEKEEKYMYLQGGRLQKPRLRSQAHNKRGKRVRRDGSRLSYFLPKRYNWDPERIHDISNFWNMGIGVHSKDYRSD